MKVILTEIQLKNIIENYTSKDDFYSLQTQYTYDVFQSILNKEKIYFNTINPNQYKTALTEFMKYGQFVRFPERIIFEWKDLIIENVVLLGVLTSIHGHTQYFPYDEFYDVFDHLKIPKKYKNDFGYIYDQILDKKYNIDNYVPFFKNGQPVLSDYGLRPLEEIVLKLLPENNPEKIILLIDRVMNVVHMRSDLAELFIDGGSDTLTYISNS